MGRKAVGERLSAAELLALVVDDASFEPWFDDLLPVDPLGFTDTMPYVDRLARAAERAGTTESVIVGRARVRGHDLVVIAGEFAFLAGTMSVSSAERVVRAFERATDLALPVLGLPVSGGTRMQEGTPAFVQMVKTAAAARQLREAGLPYLAYLRHPTTGGVLGSWASLAHLTFAEPRALIGLTGPRVIELLEGQPLPEGIQVAEHLAGHGIIDDVVAAEDLAERVDRALAVLRGAIQASGFNEPPLALPDDATIDPWEAVGRSRRTDRPGIRELLAVCAQQVTPLRGDGAGNDDPGCTTALARVCGVPVVLVGHDRPSGQRGSRLGAAGFRKARRAMALAAELELPLVTIIDTAGARSTSADEEHGVAREIAGCLATMSGLEVPTLSLLLGEGTGGGALAFLPADRVVAA
ncbi:MAG: acetyl-CoA carboxyl transferase, partial [Nitriliruptorales bacterium]|nr:acetyl-CoA carboxyl transferase [Nitriliruptorales bacterium]